jgi:hypothetical protein
MKGRSGRRAVGKKNGGGGSGVHMDWSKVLLEEIRLAGLPEPTREYTFHAARQWRFDFSWKESGQLVACEIEGGIWMQTVTGRSKGHAHPERFESDCEKYNEAALYGWVVIRVTPDMIRDGRAIDWLERALLVELLEEVDE